MPREHARYESMTWDEYEFAEFPKMIYPGAADPKKPYVNNKGRRNHGKPLNGILVQNEEEERQALALEPEPDEDDEDTVRPLHIDQHDRVSAGTQLATNSPGTTRMATEMDERKKLIEEAETAGVQIDKRWSVAKIQDALDSHHRDVV